MPRRSPLRAAIKTGRPKEWIKNVFVFAGLLFSGKFNQSHEVLEAVITFVAFCLISSAGYFVNDLIDVELDRKHPKKRFRPLAAGELSESTAKRSPRPWPSSRSRIAFATVNWEVGLMVVGYGVAQMAYSLGLKQIVIIDVMTLAGLFILRVAAGASAVDAHASEWLILCTGMLAAFLGFTKRRQEAVSELHEGTSTRPVLEHYSLPFLDQMVSLVTTGTVISYAIYTVNSPLIGSQMMLTIPPVVYGIFRYLYLIYDRSDDRSMAAIVAGDRGIQARRRRLRAGRLPAALRLQLARRAQGRQASSPRARAFHQVEAGAAELLAVDLDDGGVGAGGLEVGGGADRHHQALLLAGGHAGRAAGLEAGGQALAELDPVGVLDRDHELVRVVGLVPGDVDAEADVEGPLVRQLGQAQDVPAAAVEVELAVDRLAVVGEQEEADVHGASSGRGRRRGRRAARPCRRG